MAETDENEVPESIIPIVPSGNDLPPAATVGPDPNDPRLQQGTAGTNRDPDGFRRAYSAVLAYKQNYAEPILSMLDALSKVNNVEAALAEAEQRLLQVRDEHANFAAALEQAKVDRETLLNATQHDRDVLAADADRSLKAHQQAVQVQIDQLYLDLEEKKSAAVTDMATLDQQIQSRLNEQRTLDATIQQKRVILADITLQLANAGIKPASV